MLFTGNTPPFHITQPSTDNDVQIVSPTATMATLTCSLNVTIPSSMIVQWTHNNQRLPSGDPTGNTTTLVIDDFQPSDVDVYQCLFSDIFDSKWILTRNINLLVPSTFVDTLSKIECSAVL